MRPMLAVVTVEVALDVIVLVWVEVAVVVV
jgi:hypothetical protein